MNYTLIAYTETIMTKFNFTDRASYLAWRAEWKANYKQISTDIRRLKVERSKTNSVWAKGAVNDCRENWRLFSIALTALTRMQSDAIEALETLKEAKIKACELRNLRIEEEKASKEHSKELPDPVTI